MKQKTIILEMGIALSLVLLLSGCSSSETEPMIISETLPEASTEKGTKITSCEQFLTFQEVAEACAITLPPSTLYEGASISGFIDPERRSECKYYAMVPEGTRDYEVVIINTLYGAYDSERAESPRNDNAVGFRELQDLNGVGKRAYQYLTVRKPEPGPLMRWLVVEANDGRVWELSSKPWEIEPLVDSKINWQTWQSCNFEEMQKIAKKIESRVLSISE